MVAIYVFVGNSGVISFGQISFVAVGAFASGVMTVPLESKKGVLPTLFPLLRDHTIGNVPSLLLAAGSAALFALPGRPAADAAVRPRRGDRHLRGARDHAQHPPQWDEDRPRRDDALARAGDDRACWQATLGALVVIASPSLYQRSRLGRQLRASREDPAAAAASASTSTASGSGRSRSPGRWPGFAGALLVHQLGSITTEQVYLELTFLTLAMLVVGGVTSLWGAVVGALAISGLDSFLSQAEQGVHVLGFKLDLPPARGWSSWRRSWRSC